MVNKPMRKVPLILDTDIGSDIDDSWALAFLLNSPEVDLRYVLAATGDTEYRAQVIVKMLQAAGRSDVPIGTGRQTMDFGKTLEAWVDGVDVSAYSGVVYQDGAMQLVQLVMSMDETPTILCIGPMTNLADALALEPGIAERCHMVAMSGSLETHEDGHDGQIAEWNVRKDISAAQKVYSAPWKTIRIAPLDSCGVLRLNGELLEQVRSSTSSLARSLITSVDRWAECLKNREWPERSSILFDTVAAYLCFGAEYLKMEEMSLVIDDEGYMLESESGAKVECALGWNDMEGFKQLLVDRLTQYEDVQNHANYNSSSTNYPLSPAATT